MAVAPELGELLDLAKAIGLVKADGTLDPAWFGDPAGHTAQLLRSPVQREAFLRGLDALLGQEGDVELDEQGRSWVPVVVHGGVALHLVVETQGAVTLLGLGARLRTSAPVSVTEVLVPLVRVPAGSKVTIVPSTKDGRLQVRTEIALGGVPSAPGLTGLQGIAFEADVAADGTTPKLSVLLRGLQLPGDAVPHDLLLDGSGSASALGDQAVRVVVGLVQAAVASATGPLAELLALAGLTKDPAVPPLPVAGILAQGVAPWRGWLEQVVGTPAARDAWLSHLAALVAAATSAPGSSLAAGAAPSVTEPSAPGEPYRVTWTVAVGVTVAATIGIGATTAGAPKVELGVAGRAEGTGTPPAALELDAVLAGITLGPAPAVRALPRLDLLARLGPEPGTTGAGLFAVTTPDAPGVPGHPVSVRYLRAGFALDAGRRPVLVLAAHDVQVAAHHHAVLDLTNPQTLADLGTGALEDLAGTLLHALGPAEAPVRVLLGLTAPPGGAWPVALTTLPALLGGPVTAVAGYHERVLRTHRAGYPGLLAPLGALLLATATGGGDGGETSLQAVAGDGAALGPAGGAGTEEDPWRLPLADGVALAVWALDAELHVGVAVDRAVTDLGGGCPTVALALIAELARIRLAPLAGQALTRLEAHVRFGARGGVPLRLGDAGAALVAQTIGVGVRWSAGAPLRAALEAPGMVADVGGHQAPIALPAVASDGTFEAEPPWAALELLSGHLLRRTGLPWAARAVDLLGWLPDDGGPGTAGRLPLEDLATDPVRALRAWALGTALPELAAWVALLVAGPAGPGMRSGPAPGRGDAGSPRAVPLPAGQGAGLAAGAGAAPPARGARLLLWDRAGRGPELEAFRPGALIAWIGAPTGTSAPPSGEQLAAPLRAAAASGRLAANLADGRDALGAGLAALVARFTNGDGLVPATGAPPAGVTVHDLPGVAHPSLPGAVDLAALGAPAAAAVVVALGPFGPASWPGVAPERTLDLTAPGLPIEAFDVTGPATAPGPWAVRLPRRADAVAAPGEDGLERQAARLARVVDAVVARAAGGPVAVVGAGAAGHAAARVAATCPGITHLVTVGTAHEPLALDLLDAPAAGDALRLLDALLPEPDPARPEHPAVVLGRALLAPWRGLLRATDPLADLAPPPAAPAIPPSVAVHRVRGKVGATAASKAVAALVVRALQEAFEADPGPLREDGGGLGCGLALRLAPPTADRAVRVRADLALALPGPGTAPGAGRALRVRVDVDRAGGWLAGGPEPGRPAAAPRGPSLRRATVELDVPLGADDAAAPRARIVLHEGEALGVRRVRWDLTEDSGPLTAEARVLVGLLAGAFGPLPAAGPVRELVGVLAALGLTQPGTSGATDAPVALSVEGVQRLLLDPGALLAEAPAGPLAAALAALCGAPPPAPAAPARFTLAVDGLIATVDLTARTVRVETVASGVRLAAGAVARGTLDLAADGAVAGSLALALGGGLTLEAALPAATVRLLVTDGGAPGGLPAAVALAPQPDAVGLRRLLAALAPAEVLWAGITFVRGLEQPGVDALVDPLLRAVRLLRPDGRLVVPTGFLADPGRWLARLLPAAPATSAPSALVAAATTTPTPDAIAAAWDALGALLGVPSARAGTWALPYGLELSAGTSGGRARLGVAVPTAPSGVGLRLTGTASLLVGRGLPPAPQGDLVLATPSAAGRLTLTAGAGGTTARLAVPSLGLDVGLVPPGAGLGGDAAQAVIHALPHVLDALAALPSSHPAGGVGATVGQLGERLGLRVEKTFRADQLAQLAAAPGPQLAQRLSANPTLGLAALRDLLAPAVPTSLSLTANATELRLARTDQTGKTAFAVALSVPSTAGVQVTGALAGRTPFPGATLDAEVSVGAAGLALAHVLLGVKPAAPLRLGPLAVAPRIDLAVGTAAQDGQHLAVGLAVPDAAVSGVLRPGPPRTFGVEATGRPLAEAVTAVLLPLALDLALSTAAMGQLLARPVLGTTVKTLLDGVVFAGDAVAPGALRPAEAFDRLLRLGTNIAKAPKAPKLEVAPLTVAAHAATDSAGAQLLGLTVSLPPGERLALVKGDVTVQAEVDASWVGTTGGLTVDVVRIPKGGKPEPALLVALAGFGLRVGRPGGPLLDGFVVADSVAAHGLLEVGGSGVTAAGGQLELAGLRLPVGSATGGGNRLAQGIMRDSAAGTEPLAPKFSPALAVTRRAGKLSVDLRAGEGAGPWFLPIQRGFGPVYVEQIGFGVTRSADRVSAARVLVDGRVSLLGLTVAVDDLALQAPWPQDGGGPDVTQPGTWEIGLAGLAVSAESSGLSLSGGLRRVSSTLPNYEGMISLRFGPYGLTAYGGYAVLLDEQGHDFTSLFIFGALNAPLGGPPAFFVTGIGAGVGLNRLLRMPPTLADLPDHPLVAALNPSSGLAKDPMAALVKLDKYFPAERGAFWFAAGVSFTSFALVDAVAVLGVAVADGLELSLLGLARAALPTPAAPLAQLELALLARFSTREGILWVQAQLTDNSWLLSRDVRLTGGFAFVSWFKGDKAGEFVLTVGGYHPSFHRDGYPVVPRVGFRWAVGKALVVKGETYFALTSEAIMAGARLEASLTLGPLWASLRVGADGIVFFDPFRFEVTAFAELGAGITVDVDLGIFGHLRFTIGFHLHADVLLAGPNFHGTATIDLGVTSATIAFGEISGPPALPLVWDDFLGKYLQPAGARVLTAVPGRGQLPQPTTSSKTPPTGEPGDPFLVQPEFGLEITTTAATTKLAIGTAPPVAVAGADPLAIGPMQEAVVTSTLGVSIIGSTGEQAQAFGRTPVLGRFPKGVWGPQADDAPLPKGETLGAATGVRLDAAVSRGPGVSPVEYHQVEIGPRLPNPLLAALNLIVGPAPPPAVAGATPAEAFALAERRLREGALGRPPTPTALALLRTRLAPPQLVPLTAGLGAEPLPHVDVVATRTLAGDGDRHRDGHAPPPAPSATAPTGRAVLRLAVAPGARPRPRTTAGAHGEGLPRVAPPGAGTVAAVRERHDPRLPLMLELREPLRLRPAFAGPGEELRRGVGVGAEAAAQLRAAGAALADGGLDVAGGEVVVLDLPGAERDDDERRRPRLHVEGATRVVALDTVGGVVLDATPARGEVALPLRTARLALVGGGGRSGAAIGWASGTWLVQVGGRVLVGPGCTVQTTALATRRRRVAVSTAFVRAARAVDGLSVVTTRLPADVRTVAVQHATHPGGGDILLELGIAGADLEGEPLRVTDGDLVTEVHRVRPEPGARDVAVTVASGADVGLGGVLGSALDAEELAGLVAEQGLAALLGDLVPDPEAHGTVRLDVPHVAPAAGPPRR